MDTVGSAGGDPLRTLPHPKSNRNWTPLLFIESSLPLCREPLEPFSLSWSSCPWDLWPSQIQTQTTMTTTTTTTTTAKTTTNMQNFQLSPYRSLLPTTLQIQQCPQIEYQQWAVPRQQRLSPQFRLQVFHHIQSWSRNWELCRNWNVSNYSCGCLPSY